MRASYLRSWRLWILGAVLLIGGLAALAHARRPRSVDPGRRGGHWAAVARGRAALRRGQPDLALRAVMNVRDEGPGAGEAMAVAGQALTQLDQLKGARMALERALRLQPNQPEAAKTLAAICLSTGDSRQGLEYLQTAARLNPKDFRPWYAMGKVYRDLGELDKAAQVLSEALRLDGGDREARAELIDVLLQLYLTDQATPWLAAALRDQPQDARVLALAAVHARDQGRTDEASEFAERALALDPDNLEARLVRARMHLGSGRTGPAREDLEHVVAINPNDAGALSMLAQVESMMGHADRSAEYTARHHRVVERARRMDELTKEIARRPYDPEPRWQLGQVAVGGGLTVLARQSFQAALDLDPSFAPARASLAELMASGPTGQSDPPGR